jgi:hypothetical protein
VKSVLPKDTLEGFLNRYERLLTLDVLEEEQPLDTSNGCFLLSPIIPAPADQTGVNFVLTFDDELNVDLDVLDDLDEVDLDDDEDPKTFVNFFESPTTPRDIKIEFLRGDIGNDELIELLLNCDAEGDAEDDALVADDVDAEGGRGIDGFDAKTSLNLFSDKTACNIMIITCRFNNRRINLINQEPYASQKQHQLGVAQIFIWWSHFLIIM